ncbi:hypothetical protein M8J77_001644 [Diaphorina citri]|nr:hypothetical protein M8J77_001644 [Diaphorina citri]
MKLFLPGLENRISAVTRKTRKINEKLVDVEEKKKNYKMKQKEALSDRERQLLSNEYLSQSVSDVEDQAIALESKVNELESHCQANINKNKNKLLELRKMVNNIPLMMELTQIQTEHEILTRENQKLTEEITGLENQIVQLRIHQKQETKEKIIALLSHAKFRWNLQHLPAKIDEYHEELKTLQKQDEKEKSKNSYSLQFNYNPKPPVTSRVDVKDLDTLFSFITPSVKKKKPTPPSAHSTNSTSRPHSRTGNTGNNAAKMGNIANKMGGSETQMGKGATKMVNTGMGMSMGRGPTQMGPSGNNRKRFDSNTEHNGNTNTSNNRGSNENKIGSFGTKSHKTPVTNHRGGKHQGLIAQRSIPTTPRTPMLARKDVKSTGLDPKCVERTDSKISKENSIEVCQTKTNSGKTADLDANNRDNTNSRTSITSNTQPADESGTNTMQRLQSAQESQSQHNSSTVNGKPQASAENPQEAAVDHPASHHADKPFNPIQAQDRQSSGKSPSQQSQGQRPQKLPVESAQGPGKQNGKSPSAGFKQQTSADLNVRTVPKQGNSEDLYQQAYSANQSGRNSQNVNMNEEKRNSQHMNFNPQELNVNQGARNSQDSNTNEEKRNSQHMDLNQHSRNSQNEENIISSRKNLNQRGRNSQNSNINEKRNSQHIDVNQNNRNSQNEESIISSRKNLIQHRNSQDMNQHRNSQNEEHVISSRKNLNQHRNSQDMNHHGVQSRGSSAEAGNRTPVVDSQRYSVNNGRGGRKSDSQGVALSPSPSKKPKLQGVGNEEEMRDAERSPEPDTEQYLEPEQYDEPEQYLEPGQFVDQDVSTQHSENTEYNEQDDMTGADEEKSKYFSTEDDILEEAPGSVFSLYDEDVGSSVVSDQYDMGIFSDNDQSQSGFDGNLSLDLNNASFPDQDVGDRAGFFNFNTGQDPSMQFNFF